MYCHKITLFKKDPLKGLKMSAHFATSVSGVLSRIETVSCHWVVLLPVIA